MNRGERVEPGTLSVGASVLLAFPISKITRYPNEIALSEVSGESRETITIELEADEKKCDHRYHH